MSDEQSQGRSRANGAADDDDERKALLPWHYRHPSSRIYRVSRASGGKDRHSKVVTAKGIRDRRVRLSVSTAIQFYDLQDRLGVDQPSKAIEWLIKAAAASIDKLPPLDGTFPVENQKPATSSTSETSRGSVLSLSQSDVKPRRRRESKKSSNAAAAAASSFTQLLTGGAVTTAYASDGYFVNPPRSAPSTGFSISGVSPFQMSFHGSPADGDRLQYFHPDTIIMPPETAGEYSLGFSIVDAGRGTLQSISHSSQFKTPSALDSASSIIPFFFSTHGASNAGENHFSVSSAAFDGRKCKD